MTIFFILDSFSHIRFSWFFYILYFLFVIFLIGASTETLRYPKCAGVWQLTIELICSIGPADFGWWLLLSCIDQYKFHWNHESASPVYIECVDFLSISIYTLSNTSLVNGDGHVYIEGVNFDQQFYPHWTLLSFGSNRMNNYTKLYTCFRMNVHHLPDIATSRSHINRCKCLWLECPYDI